MKGREQEQPSDDDEGDVDDDDNLEVEGLILVKSRERTQLEVTPESVGRLQDIHMENFNRRTDHNGKFQECEVVSMETAEGELLYILPCSVIDRVSSRNFHGLLPDFPRRRPRCDIRGRPASPRCLSVFFCPEEKPATSQLIID